MGIGGDCDGGMIENLNRGMLDDWMEGDEMEDCGDGGCERDGGRWWGVLVGTEAGE